MHVSLQLTKLSLQLAQLSPFSINVVIESVSVKNAKSNVKRRAEDM